MNHFFFFHFSLSLSKMTSLFQFFSNDQKHLQIQSYHPCRKQNCALPDWLAVCGVMQPSLIKASIHKTRSYFSTFCTRKPATTPMVVGRLAAHTPSRFSVFSSTLEATTRGGAHWNWRRISRMGWFITPTFCQQCMIMVYIVYHPSHGQM